MGGGGGEGEGREGGGEAYAKCKCEMHYSIHYSIHTAKCITAYAKCKGSKAVGHAETSGKELDTWPY